MPSSFTLRLLAAAARSFLRRGKIYRNLQGWRARGIATLLAKKVPLPNEDGATLNFINELLDSYQDNTRKALEYFADADNIYIQRLLSKAIGDGEYYPHETAVELLGYITPLPQNITYAEFFANNHNIVKVMDGFSQWSKQKLFYKSLQDQNPERQRLKVELLLCGNSGIKPTYINLKESAVHGELFDTIFAASDQQTREHALMVAITGNMATNDLTAAKRLLAVVDPNIVDNNGNTLLMLAAKHCPKLIEAILAKMNFSEEAKTFFLDCIHETDLVKTLLKDYAFVNPNSRNSEGMTPLTGAVRAGQVASVDALLTDPEIKNHLNKTTTLAEVLAVVSPPNTVKFRPCRAAIACLKYIDANAVIEYVTTIFIPEIREVISNSEIQNCLKERLQKQLTDAEERFGLNEAPAAELGR
jgi:hypothetical protein